MLTTDGVSLLWQIAAGLSDDSLAGGTIVVSDGTAHAASTFDAPPRVDGGALRLVATFGEEVANFEWASTEVVSAGGVVVDRSVADNGRKTAGAVWTLETVLDLAASA